ncbi:hypothetical protein JCM3775_000346 [Rhodotorula graminis]
MGLFSHKDKTSPSGFFTVDQTPTDERSESDAINNRPRTSTSSGGRTSQDAARHSSSSTGAAAGAAAAAAGAAGASRARTSHDGGAAAASASPKVDHARSSGPLTNEVHSSPSSSSGLPAGAAPAAAAAAAATTAAHHHSTAFSSPTVAPTSAREVNNPSSSSTAAASAGLPSIQDQSAGLTRGATLKERSATPHSHHAQPGSDAVLSEEQAKLAEHDHKYLQPVVHERRHIHEVEELERHRVVDRHVHHVQHHVQPLVDERHLETVHSYREVPVTHVEEVHANTPDDRALLARLNAQSMSTYTVVPHQRVKVDKGETQVTENVVHHYHTIVMPVWQRDLHEFYRLNSNFSPASMLNSSGGPAAAHGHAQQHNVASPSVQHGAFGSVSHPPGAKVVPGGVSLMGPPQAREGHKLVPDSRPEIGGESTAYEVEYVNREPVFTSSATHPVQRHGLQQQQHSPLQQQQQPGAGIPGAHARQSSLSSSVGRHARTSSLGQTVPGGNLATTTGGHHHGLHQQQQASSPQMAGLEQGMQNTNLGVAR